MQEQDSGVVLHGAVGGAVAGLVVVIWFLVADIVAGQAFQTPAQLSSLVLHEEFDKPWPRLFALYTVLHFGVFITLGVVTMAYLHRTFGSEVLQCSSYSRVCSWALSAR